MIAMKMSLTDYLSTCTSRKDILTFQTSEEASLAAHTLRTRFTDSKDISISSSYNKVHMALKATPS